MSARHGGSKARWDPPFGHARGIVAAVEVVDVARAADLIGRDGVVVLDVRTPQEFHAARIEGAENADWYRPDFTTLIEHLDRTAPTVIYCRSGRRSNEAMLLMDRLGFAELYDVGGGIIAWFEDDQPLEQGPPTTG